MTATRPSLDPLRYGLRALAEMSRAQASVAVPSRHDEEVFAPSTTLQAPAREGAAFTLRLFSDGPDDATRFVLREVESLTFDPIPARARALFEAHAASRVYQDDEVLVVGFPLVTFSQQGQQRAAPLLSWSGAAAAWLVGEAAWTLDPRARAGDAMAVPSVLRLDGPSDDDDETALTLHAGLWSSLLGADGATLTEIARVGDGSAAKLVRAATMALQEEALDLGAIPGGPLTRDDLSALCDAVVARATPRSGARCFPHGLVMLLPRGDPTMGLRADLDSLLDSPSPLGGPLSVYLGAAAHAPTPGPVWACASTEPTASQLSAVRAFEGTRDLVAVCGPPGCGKTTLLHHIAAQAIVARALEETWRRAPEGDAPPWALVVTSTNNAAVDHALAPFVTPGRLPVGIRLGSRRTLAEVTIHAIAASIEALEGGPGPSLAEAIADFDQRASVIRAALDSARARREARASFATNEARFQSRAAKLLKKLERPYRADLGEGVSQSKLEDARDRLSELSGAIPRILDAHIERPRPDLKAARQEWNTALDRLSPWIVPALSTLSLELPFRALSGGDIADELTRQGFLIHACHSALSEISNARRRPRWQREYDEIAGALAPPPHAAEEAPIAPDPTLVEAALTLRDAWARAHKPRLLPRLHEVYARLSAEQRGERRRPLPDALRALAGVFPIAGCTLLSMRQSFPLDEGVIARLVVDEAGQCAPVYAIPALARASRALITGDTAQLTPVYTIDERVDERLARGLSGAADLFRMATSSATSAQAVAEARASARLTLVEHFRSQPEIVRLASSWSGYSLDVRTPPRSLSGVCSWLSRPVMLIPVRGDGERSAAGVVNEAEARKAVSIVESMVADGVAPGDIAVLTPFVGQSARIERALQARGLSRDGGVLVRTVHKLQGGERRVVVFSLTATQRRHLAWITERPNLLHVATSRAQDHLVVLLNLERARSEAALAPLCDIERPR